MNKERIKELAQDAAGEIDCNFYVALHGSSKITTMEDEHGIVRPALLVKKSDPMKVRVDSLAPYIYRAIIKGIQVTGANPADILRTEIDRQRHLNGVLLDGLSHIAKFRCERVGPISKDFDEEMRKRTCIQAELVKCEICVAVKVIEVYEELQAGGAKETDTQ